MLPPGFYVITGYDILKPEVLLFWNYNMYT
jgi:hypothetical protein